MKTLHETFGRSRFPARFSLVVVAFGLTAALTPAPARAQNNGLRQDGEGRYAQLSASWWQWVYSIEAIDVGGTNTNPVLDTTGAYAATGQQDGQGPGNKYFFLAGTFGSNAERHVTVPRGKTLFFPIYNFEVDNAVAPPTNFTVPELRALAKANIDALQSAFCTLNGGDVDIFRTKMGSFSYTVTDGFSIYDYFGSVGPQFEGTVKPAVADGYWSVIPPLPPGEYLLEFGATAPAFSLNVVYHLTIP
jgi:hypothetical protein